MPSSDTVLLDWLDGEHRLTPPDPGDGPTWRASFAADWMPRGGHIPALRQDPAGFYGDLLEVITSADLRVVNLECPLGELATPIIKDGPVLDAPGDLVAGLTAARFDLACLANNHTMDHGPEGLASTLDILATAGIQTVGAALDPAEITRPWLGTVAGADVAVINCAEGEASRPPVGGAGAYAMDPPLTIRQIAEHKAAGRAVVVVFHGGREYVPVPPPYVVSWLRAFAEAGADLVIGHHPHVPQAIEIHHGVPICYSLGNFAFHFDNDNLMIHVGYLLDATFSGTRLTAIRPVPYLITADGLRRLDADETADVGRALNRAATPLLDQAQIHQAWDAVVDHFVTDERLARLFGQATGQVAGPQPYAVLGNMFLTAAHHELFARGLLRRAAGRTGDAPAWATELLGDYLGRTLTTP